MAFIALAGLVRIFYTLLLAADALGILLGFNLRIATLVVRNGLHPMGRLLVSGGLLVDILLCTVLSLCHMYRF